MGIRTKLVLFLLFFGFIILGALLWSNNAILHKTMLHYVDQRDQQRLERLKNNLEVYLNHYEPIDQIDEISSQDWRSLMKVSHRSDLSETPYVMALLMDKPRFRRFRPPPPLDDFERRVSLIGLNNQVVYGSKEGVATILLPVMMDGEKMAMIGYYPLHELVEQADIEFAESQIQVLWFGAVLVTLLVLILLWPLANHFLIPIQQLTLAMKSLAQGKFSQRLSINRKDELGRLQLDFNHLASILEATQDSRNQWIADISHELRTPLTILNGTLEAMIDSIRPITAENLKVMQQEVDVLKRLIEDLYQLSLSDVGAMRYEMQQIDLADLVNLAIEHFENKAQYKGLQISKRVIVNHAQIYGDTTRLQQLLQNLLQNAVDYTEPQDQAGKVEVSLSQQDDNWILTIEDSAPGIADKDLQQLSERFYRGESSRNRKTGGAGLGLAIVSQIVKAHHGQLHFENSVLGGFKG